MFVGNKLFTCLWMIVLLGASNDLMAATKKTVRQSAIQKGTTVRVKTDASGVYDQECYDAYFGCMDQFCISDNESGGSCICSDAYVAYEEQLNAIKESLIESERISTVEVEKVKAGADADIIFLGKRQYDKAGNVLSLEELEEKKKGLLALWDDVIEEDEEEYEPLFSGKDFTGMTGDVLHAAAQKMCQAQMPEKCAPDAEFLMNMYARQVVSDCKGLENILIQKQAEADLAMAEADAAVRAALQESLSASNKYTLGECMVEFKKCMRGADVCGTDWEHCVGQVASENMQNFASRGKSYGSKSVYKITEATLETLEVKRPICERVLSSCVAVRDNVWPSFLKEVAPTIQLAESHIESRFRQSCLTDISNCIHTACKDDIAGKGVATMDSCLAYPEMARSFCKVELEPCEKMEPLIWNYVTDKLAAMRVDACTQEVKDCFTHESRCGENFQNCIGMDYEYIHNICPIDSLVVCKQGNSEFSMADLDEMLMGLYLNIDTTLATRCQEIVDKKMMEVCGSTTDCNKFASDDTIGTGSLRSQKLDATYRVSGMISFGSIKVGSALDSKQVHDAGNLLLPGQIGIEDYLAHVIEDNEKVPNYESIVSNIEAELRNIEGKINMAIELIESDPEVQYCISGRDLEHVTGVADAKTVARFPNLIKPLKVKIAAAALRQAQDNYNAKWNKMIADATKNASADIAQYMCQMMPSSNGAAIALNEGDKVETLAEPYAILYDVSTGLESGLLTQGGHSTRDLGKASTLDTTAGASKFSEIVNSFTGLGSNRAKMNLETGTREMWSVFNRDTRVCRLCSLTVTKDCTSISKKGFLGIGAKNELNCTEGTPVEKCEDIPM